MGGQPPFNNFLMTKEQIIHAEDLKTLKKIINNRYVQTVVIMILTSVTTYLFTGAAVVRKVSELDIRIDSISHATNDYNAAILKNQKDIIEAFNDLNDEVTTGMNDLNVNYEVLTEKLSGLSNQVERNSKLIDKYYK